MRRWGTAFQAGAGEEDAMFCPRASPPVLPFGQAAKPDSIKVKPSRLKMKADFTK